MAPWPQSQTFTITDNQSSAEPFFFDCRGLPPFSFSFLFSFSLFLSQLSFSFLSSTTSELCSVPAYDSLSRTPRKTSVTCQVCMFIGPLPSKGCPIIESVTSGRCLQSHCLATVICVTICLFENKTLSLHSAPFSFCCVHVRVFSLFRRVSLVWEFQRKLDLLVICLFGLLFDLEDVGSTFVRNVEKKTYSRLWE
jgi:hypothetical protein